MLALVICADPHVIFVSTILTLVTLTLLIVPATNKSPDKLKDPPVIISAAKVPAETVVKRALDAVKLVRLAFVILALPEVIEDATIEPDDMFVIVRSVITPEDAATIPRIRADPLTSKLY